MNKTELENTLKILNTSYKLDEWLDFSDVHAISLSTTSVIYPTTYDNGFKTQYYFDSAHELLLERIVPYDTDGNAKLTNIIPFDLIVAIGAITVLHPSESYRLAR